MRMMHIYKSNKYQSMICRISQKPRTDRKIKTVKVFFVKNTYEQLIKIESAVSL